MAEITAEYIVNHIDEAIENKYIKVFAQPVVRTLTQKVCGFEALSRWDDPIYGLISPGIFIPALEQGNLIHKLDTYVVRELCNYYKKRMVDNMPIIPASFNLSRQDFDNCDICNSIESSVVSSRVPRELIHVEITESLIGSDQEYMKEKIDDLHRMGYEVWMDDFGSEYSSLNVLKDFDFDVLKIDIKFVKGSFNDKTKKIIRSIVDMAKHIGVFSLAEGVETKEQFEFFREIGCDKIQGFYFGKPVIIDELYEYISRQNLQIEAISDRKYMEMIDRINLIGSEGFDKLSDQKKNVVSYENARPLAIVEIENGIRNILYYNTAFLEELHSIGIETTMQLHEILLNADTAVGKQVVAALSMAKYSGKTERFDFIRNNYLCTCRFIKIAENPRSEAYLCEFRNLANDTEYEKIEKLNNMSRVIYNLYERVDIIDIPGNTWTNIYSNTATSTGYTPENLENAVHKYVTNDIHPAERESFLEFYDLSTMMERIHNAPSNIITSPVRLKLNTGNEYAWMLLIITYCGLDRSKLLSCLRPMSPEEIIRIVKTHKRYHNDDDIRVNLWDAIFYNSEIGMFYKDKDRRFLDVNNAFLDYYSFESKDAVLGKTDEEVGWHIDTLSSMGDELEVIKRGIQTVFEPIDCIKNGEIHHILASKMPVYVDGKIEGLLGYFMDTENMTASIRKNDAVHDKLTGVMNTTGFMNACVVYQDSYITEKQDFAFIYFDIRHYKNINKMYGIDMGNRLLKGVADIISGIVSNTGIVARIGGDHFIVVVAATDRNKILEMGEKIHKELNNVHYIDGEKISIFVDYSYAFYSDFHNMEQMQASVRTRIQEKKDSER